MCSRGALRPRPSAGGGRGWLLHCRLDAVIGSARGKLHMVEGTWVLAMEVAMVASCLLWFQTSIAVLLASRPQNWWDLSSDYLARIFVNSHPARL
jgi:hypothetical protein